MCHRLRCWPGSGRGWPAERGLSRETVRCYCNQAGTFLASLPDPVESAVRQLDSGQVTSFMVGYCRDRNVESAKAMATSLRALLRFLHVSGHTPIGLAGAVPGVAGWRLASLPRGLDAAVVAQLLGSCDQATVVGRRDYAILIMLVRLGLRGAEAADLRLGDLDWRAGEVTVRGKGNRIDRLPMPSDVGEAIVAYLTDGRPDCADADGVRYGAQAVSAAHGGGDPRHHGTGVSPRGPAAGGCASVAAHAGHRHAARRGVAAAGRAGAAASQRPVHRDLRQGGRKRAATAGAAVANCGGVVMTGLRRAAEDYLAMRRALGFKLTTQGSATDVVRRLLRVPRQRPDHQRPGAGVGDDDPQRQHATTAIWRGG